MRLLDSAFESDWTKALRQARETKKLKQNVVAQQIGVHRASLCQWETGVSCPSTFGIWNKWAKAVGLPDIITQPPELDDDAD